MTGRLRRLVLVALLPSAVDVALLVLLRQGLGWILVVADLSAIVVASGLSYVVHRLVTFRSDPYVRWVKVPWAFVGVAALAALVDVAVLRAGFAATGFETTTGLLKAKMVALVCAAAVRAVGYRAVLLVTLTQQRAQRADRPDPPGDLRLSVVIPAYQEADRIASTIATMQDELEALAPDAPGGQQDAEIVVVDDGSSDDTAGAARRAGADQVVVQPLNQGKGAAVRAGVLASRGRTVVFTDADLAYRPDQVVLAMEAVESGWDVVIGNRRHPESNAIVAQSWLRSAGSQVVNLLVYLVLLGSYRDTQSGLKGFRSDAGRFIFSRARVDGFAFDIELLHIVERHGLSVAEIPVEVTNSARSTVRPGRAVFRLLGDIYRIRHWSATGAYE